ncbi:MAG: hypothetical protein WD429_10795 [Marinobacter sp.]
MKHGQEFGVSSRAMMAPLSFSSGRSTLENDYLQSLITEQCLMSGADLFVVPPDGCF